MEKNLLTLQNYRQGFLVDEQCMAGVSPNAEKPGEYVAFVLLHETGEYLGYQSFSEAEHALTAINQIPREWNFESVSSCGGGKCGKAEKAGACCGGSCKITGQCELS